MDTQASLRWLETMKREKNAKLQWEQKYLTAEELQRSQEEQDELGAIEAAKPPPGKRLTERDVMMQRLSKYAAGRPEEEPPPKYRRLKPGGEVRLRYGYVLTCDEVNKRIHATRWMCNLFNFAIKESE